MGRIWQLLVGGIAPVVLGYILIGELQKVLAEGYGGMPRGFVNTFGWGMALGLIVVAIILSLLPWPAKSNAQKVDSDGDLIPPPILDRLVDANRVEEARANPIIDNTSLPLEPPAVHGETQQKEVDL